MGESSIKDPYPPLNDEERQEIEKREVKKRATVLPVVQAVASSEPGDITEVVTREVQDGSNGSVHARTDNLVHESDVHTLDENSLVVVNGNAHVQEVIHTKGNGYHEKASESTSTVLVVFTPREGISGQITSPVAAEIVPTEFDQIPDLSTVSEDMRTKIENFLAANQALLKQEWIGATATMEGDWGKNFARSLGKRHDTLVKFWRDVRQQGLLHPHVEYIGRARHKTYVYGRDEFVALGALLYEWGSAFGETSVSDVVATAKYALGETPYAAIITLDNNHGDHMVSHVNERNMSRTDQPVMDFNEGEMKEVAALYRYFADNTDTIEKLKIKPNHPLIRKIVERSISLGGWQEESTTSMFNSLKRDGDLTASYIYMCAQQVLADYNSRTKTAEIE